MSSRAAAPENAMSDSKPRLRRVRCMTLANASSSSTIKVLSKPSEARIHRSVVRPCSRRCPPGIPLPKLNGSNLHPIAVGLRTMSLEVQARQTDAGVTVLAPSGRLDVAGAPSLKDAVTEAVKNGPPRGHRGPQAGSQLQGRPQAGGPQSAGAGGPRADHPGQGVPLLRHCRG